MLNSINLNDKKIQTVSLGTFNLILAIWISLALNFGFLAKLAKLTPYEGFKASFFLIATALVLVALYNLIFQWVQWKFNAKIFAFIFIIIGGFSAYFVNTLGVVISPDQIQNMIQTDPNEVKDLITVRLFIWFVAFIVLPLCFFYWMKIKPEPIPKLLIKKLISSFISIIVIVGLLFVFYIDYASIFRENRDLKGMISPQNTISSVYSYYKKKSPAQNLPLIRYGEDAHLVEQIAVPHHPKLMVLVVGETARAESFSLNGYTKKTNPELSKLNIINYANVSSCGTATAVSVPCMFSGMARKNYDESLALHREGLLDIAQRAGYKVTWIDNNSGCKETCNRVNQFVIPKDLKDKWCVDGECYDEILVDSLKYYLNTLPKNDSTPQLIVLHQMGSHGPAYYKRATEKFQPFQPTCNTTSIQGCTQEELLNSYDNSIVYTDHVLSSIIQTLKAVPNYQTGFWYLSDHGESTGEHGLYLHGAPYAMAPTQQTHVPMIMWFSPLWQQQNPPQMTCLNEEKNQKLSHDNLFPTLLNLLNVKTHVTDESYDILKRCKTLSTRA